VVKELAMVVRLAHAWGMALSVLLLCGGSSGLLALSGCSSGSSVAPDPGSPTVGSFGLPAPSALVKGASYTDAFRSVEGKDYTNHTGSDNHVTANGTTADFAPVWDGSGSPTFHDAAIGTYWFDIHDYNDTPTIEFDWATPPSDYHNLYVGLAEWGSDRWKWYSATGPVVSLPSMVPYISTSNGIAVTVVLLGTDTARLNSIRVGPLLWTIQTIDSSVDAGEFCSLALDSAGLPHFAYYDADGGDLRYAYLDSGGTPHTAVVDSTGDVGRACALALDSDDNPHISYFDLTESDLKYAYYDGSIWQITPIDFSDNDVLPYSSIAIQAPDTPHLAYYKTGPQDIIHAYFDGSSWVKETVNTVHVVSYLSLALNDEGKPAIAYGMGSSVGYSFYDGAVWHNETVASGNMDIAGERVLDFDLAGQACLVYYDFDTAHASFARRETGGWTTAVIPSEASWGTNASLAVDSSGVAHMSCYCSGLEYARLDGTDWSFVTVDTGWTGLATCLALDGDLPCISCYHAGDKELRYARYR
jgi:hypothetical protein